MIDLHGLKMKDLNQYMQAITEALDDVDNDTLDAEVPPELPSETDSAESSGNSEQELLDKLNKVFTPILVMQKYEDDTSDNVKESLSESSLLTEANIVKFDDQTRMAQLIATCALLIAQQKNTDKYQMYAQAAATRNKMKLEIQKDEYDAAKTLAQKYLIKVSTTNNNGDARKAATNLLPETQH
jgi:hypothetical protein